MNVFSPSVFEVQKAVKPKENQYLNREREHVVSRTYKRDKFPFVFCQ